MPGVVVLWGINTHKCTSCGKQGEWPYQQAGGPPTEEQLNRPCPNCGKGPWVHLTAEEMAANKAAYEAKRAEKGTAQ